VTASRMAKMPGVRAVRPGAYVFGDLHLRDCSGTHRRDQIALTVRTTVIDRPAPGLALIDAGSKTFSSDRTADGVTARALDGRDLAVTRLSEEHGFVSGKDVETLRIGDRIDWVPAHICPVVNLARGLVVERAGIPAGVWEVEAAGCNF
jgi:D-serine deaminase-like pyridoxal phosphate-dependent protein